MTRESFLGININDLKEAETKDRERNSFVGININEFPEAETRTLYDEELGKMIEVPSGIDEIETQFRINTDVKNISAQKHIAAIPIDDSEDEPFYLDVYNFGRKLANGELLSAAGKGVKYSIKSLPQLYGSYLKQNAADPNKRARSVLAGKGFSSLELDLDFPVQENKELDGYANKIISKNRERLVNAGLVPPEDDPLGQFFFDAGAGVTNLVAALGLTSIVKSPLPAAAMFSEIQKNNIYLEGREAGLTHSESMATAVPAGLVQGGLELIGLDRFFKIASGDKFIKKIIKRSPILGAQESLQKLSEDVITDIGNVRETSAEEKLDNMLYSALLGITLGAPASVIVTSLESKAEKNKISKRKIREGVAKIEESRLGDRMRKLIEKEANDSLLDPQTEAQIVADLKEATKEIKEDPQTQAETLEKVQKIRNDSANLKEESKIQEKFDKTIIEGRLKKLDEQVSSFDKELDSAFKIYESRQKDKKSTIKIEQKIKSLTRKRDLFDEERAEILTNSPTRSEQSIIRDGQKNSVSTKNPSLKSSEQSDISLRGSKVQNLGQDAIRSINNSFRKGRNLAKKDVTEAQDFITNLIDESALLPNDKAKFIRSIKNIKDAETLSIKLPEIQSRISTLVESATKRNIKSSIKKSLSKTKVKNQSGKPVGKFGPEGQVLLDKLRAISKLSAENAKLALQSKREGFADLAKSGRLPSYESSLESSLLSLIAESSDTSLSEMTSLKKDIDQIMLKGRTDREAKILAKKAKTDKIKSGINSLISEGKNLDLEESSTFKDFFKSAKGFQAWVNYAWGDIIDSLLPPSKTNSELKEVIVKEMNISQEIQREKGIVRKKREAFIDLAKESFGISKEGQLNNKFLQDSKQKTLGVFLNANNKQVRLRYSKAQARKFWMELQDPTLKKTITSKNGMAFTPEMISAITSASMLESGDIAFARGQLRLYKEFYPEINKVYSNVYHVDLINIKNYSPISRVVDKELDSNAGEFMQEIFTRLSVAPGSLKSRVNSLGELRKSSDTEVYQKHITEMAHFIAMQEKIQQVQSVFADKDVRKNIEIKAGASILELIDDTVDSFVRNGSQKSNRLGTFLNYLNRSFALSVLGGKTALAAKQMTSTLAYWDGMSAKEFASGVADFAKNPKKAIEILNKSELVKARGVPEFDLTKVGKTNQFKGLAIKNKFVNTMLLPVKFGDKGAILIGGWAYYKNQINKGKTHDQALKAFEDFTSKTQQSTDLDQITALQRMGPFGKAMTMFMSAPNAYYRAEVRAIRQFKRGEISGKEFGKKLFIYHVLLPATFQFVANGFTFDEDDQLVAVLTGPLNGFFILGDLANNFIREIFTGDSYSQSALNAFKFAREIKSGMAEIVKSGADTDEVLEGLLDIVTGVGRVSSLPVDQAKNIAEGIDNVNSGKVVRGTMRFAGWPKKSVAEIDI